MREWIDIEYTAGGVTYSESLPLDVLKEICNIDPAMPLSYEEECKLVEYYIHDIVLKIHWYKEARNV